MLVWLVCTLLASLVGRTEQKVLPLSVKDVKLGAEETYRSDGGKWVLIVEWKDENNESDQVSYDIEILHTEQMRTVHFENIHVKPVNTIYRWKWTSPIPLQCTSHSVRLRRRENHNISEWTSLYSYKEQDQSPSKLIVYPQDQVFMVGSNITFCCILKTENALLANSSDFLIRISNRTYITKPVHFSRPSSNPRIHCEAEGVFAGSEVLIGYPPDDQNLTCVTRDLSSVECNWNRGRNTDLSGEEKETNYKLNGRECKFNEGEPLTLCKLDLAGDKLQVANWTLVATNLLGSKTLTDSDDPLNRVWLKAPQQISHSAYARNVTIQWSWSDAEYNSFLMICQVLLNGGIYNKNFSGEGLASAVLEHLQPFTKYTAKVRCASDEHFYKWGDWSSGTEFSTKEDLPEPVDVWVEYSEPNTCVLWKPLTQQKSHGKITGYELTLNNTSPVPGVGPDDLYYSFTSGNTSQMITVSAKNSAGLSPPSAIIIPHNPGVSISRISGSNGGFELFWRKSPYSTCGYVVEWFQTNKKHCAVDWKKIPQWDSDVGGTWNLSGNFKAGERYTISVYACTDHAPVLLQRHEGYAEEQKPLGIVQNLKGTQIGRKIELSWTEVPLDQQKGFVLGYRVKINSESEIIINATGRKEHKVNLTLDPGSYTFKVCAFTSVGDGENAAFTMDMEVTIEKIVAATVVGCSIATLVFIMITVLCYKKRKWLKRLLYPDIPKPQLAGKLTTQGIYCTQMTEGYMKCDIQEVHSSDHPATSENPHDPDLFNSKTNLFSGQPFYQNTPSPVWPCAKKLTSIIDNPSYDLTMPEPDHVARASESLLKMQDSYLPAPNIVQPAWNSLQDSYLPATKFMQPSTIIVEDSYLPAPKFAQPCHNFVDESYVPAPQFAQLCHNFVDESYVPAPQFVQPCHNFVDESYVPAPKFVQACHNFVDASYVPVPQFVQACHNFVDESYIPAPQFVQPAFNFLQDNPNLKQNSVVVKDSAAYKPQSAFPTNT